MPTDKGVFNRRERKLEMIHTQRMLKKKDLLRIVIIPGDVSYIVPQSAKMIALVETLDNPIEPELG